jgi:hypothetical protein
MFYFNVESELKRYFENNKDELDKAIEKANLKVIEERQLETEKYNYIYVLEK